MAWRLANVSYVERRQSEGMYMTRKQTSEAVAKPVLQPGQELGDVVAPHELDDHAGPVNDHDEESRTPKPAVELERPFEGGAKHAPGEEEAGMRREE